MVTQNHFRWDFIGLSTDEKPTPATSDKVVDGSTFYCSDNSKLYVFCKDQWYEKTATGGGGSSYTAGTGINISEDTISVDTTTIQPKLTAGTNITIDENNEISATDTTYSNFTGTDGTTAGAAGLVPAPATTDADKFLKSDGTWSTAGGGGTTVVDEPGTSTTDAMSQHGATALVYRMNSATSYSDHAIKIGGGASTDNNGVSIGYQATLSGGVQSVAVGSNAKSVGYAVAIGSTAKIGSGNYGIAIGYSSGGQSVQTGGSVMIGRSATVASGVNHAIALGDFSKANYTGEMNIGTPGSAGNGYNNSDYRLITGVYDGQSAHDAATKGQLDNVLINGGTTAPTTSTAGSVGTLYSCVNSGTPEIYMCTAVSGSTYTWTKII